MPDATRQWKRRAQVIIGKSGSGLLVENLRIQFEVSKTVESAPNVAVIKIFNLNPANEAKIKNEFDEVILNAGYEGAMRLVFRGNIKHVYRYREKVDYITEIEAGDGDKDFRNAVMNETLAAGTTNAQLVDRAVNSFKGTGGTIKGAVQINDHARLRGKVIFAEAVSNLDQLIEDVYHSFSPSSATGAALSRLVQLNGIRHIGGTYSTCDVLCIGQQGTIIPTGSLIKSTATNATFQTTTDVTIDGTGQVMVSCRAVDLGAKLAPAATLTKIDTPIYGWQTANNPSDAIVGRDEETDEQLRTRRKLSTATPAQSIVDGI